MSEEIRVIELVKAMLANKDRITNVINAGGGDYWFLYKKTHKWMLKTNGQVYDLMLFNKGDQELDELAKLDSLDGIDYNVLSPLKSKKDIHYQLFNDLQNVLIYKDREFDSDLTDMLNSK